MNAPKSPRFFDSHCHLDFSDFGHAAERAGLWRQCQDQGITELLIPGVEPKQWPTLGQLVDALEGVYFALGIHPWFANDLDSFKNDNSKMDTLSDALLAQLNKSQLLTKPQCVAIGECGMDAMIDTDLSWQEQLLEAHVQLACDLDKPLIIHVRKTHNPTLQLLSRYRPSAGGVIHGFTGSIDLAKQYWQLGFYLGIGGSITYPRANKTRNTVQAMPLESLLLETDAPDMPLQGKQGQANSPLALINVAKTLAELRGESLEKVAQQTRYNAQRLFRI